MAVQAIRRRPPLVQKECWMKVKDPAMLRRWRQQKRFSQRELAFLVRRSQATIHLLETGGMKTLTEDLAIAIAARLERPWDELFDLEEHEAIPSIASASQLIAKPAQNSNPRGRRSSRGRRQP